jgi:hypothetical protein
MKRSKISTSTGTLISYTAHAVNYAGKPLAVYLAAPAAIALRKGSVSSINIAKAGLLSNLRCRIRAHIARDFVIYKRISISKQL